MTEKEKDIQIIDSVDQLDSPTYDKPNEENPEISVEKTIFAIGDNVDTIPTLNIEMLEKMKAITEQELVEFQKDNKTKNWEEEDFTFEEVDKLYNFGISEKDKKAFVVWLQTTINREIKGGFAKNYGMPLIKTKKISEWTDFISGTPLPYKTGDELDTISDKSTIYDTQNAEEVEIAKKWLKNIKATYEGLEFKDGSFKDYLKDVADEYENEDYHNDYEIRTLSAFRHPERTEDMDKDKPANDGGSPNPLYMFNQKIPAEFDLLGLVSATMGLQPADNIYFDRALYNSWKSLNNSTTILKGLVNAEFSEGEEGLEYNKFKQLQNRLGTILEGLKQTISRKKRFANQRSYNEGVSASDKDSLDQDFQGLKKRVSQFVDLIKNSRWNVFPYEDIPNEVIDLMKEGYLFYDGSQDVEKRFQPLWKFQSGNIYNKSKTFRDEKYGTKALILEQFGQEIVDQHEKALESAFNLIQENKVPIYDPEDPDSPEIDLKPTNDLCNDLGAFSVKSYINPVQSPMSKEIDMVSNIPVRIIEDKNTGLTDIDWYQVKDPKSTTEQLWIRRELPDRYKANYDKVVKILSEMTLKEAFIDWLLRAGRNSVEYGIVFKNAQYGAYALALYFSPNKQFKKFDTDTGRLRLMTTNEKATAEEHSKENIDRLFKLFLKKGLTEEQQQELETAWNKNYNSLLEPNLDKIPIGFSYKKYYGTQLNEIRKEKLRAIRFWLSRGSCGLAYGVGVGKTWCANFIVSQAIDLGLCSTPLFILPNQVYKQYINELNVIIRQEPENARRGKTRIFGLHNLGKKYLPELEIIKRGRFDNNICVITYQGLQKLYFDKEILFSNDEKDTEKPADEFWLKKQLLILLSGSDTTTDEQIAIQLADTYREQALANYDVDVSGEDQTAKKEKKKEETPIFFNGEFQPDFVVCDEVHNFKALYSKVEGKPLEFGGNFDGKNANKIARQRNNPYSRLVSESVPSKEQSFVARKLYWLIRYVQRKNPFGNSLLLSATPFTNNPLEVYAMLTYIMWEELDRNGLGYIYDFYDTYAKIGEELKPNIKGKSDRINTFIGWVNLIGLQSLVFLAFDKTSTDQEEKLVSRPNKIILPLKDVILDTQAMTPEDPSHNISTNLTYTPLQTLLYRRLQQYLNDPDDDVATSSRPVIMSRSFLLNYRPLETLKGRPDLDSEGFPIIQAVNPYYIPPIIKPNQLVETKFPKVDDNNNPVFKKVKKKNEETGEMEEIEEQVYITKKVRRNVYIDQTSLKNYYLLGGKEVGKKFHRIDEEPPNYWLNETTIFKEKQKSQPKDNSEAKKERKAKKGLIDTTISESGKGAGKKGKEARTLRGISYGKQIGLNPYLYQGSGLKTDPTPEEFIKASPKMEYAMECIKSVWAFEDKQNYAWGRSGQVLYIAEGKVAFPMIVQYALKHLGLKGKEIGVITGDGGNLGSDELNEKKTGFKGNIGKKRGKSGVADLFNGVKYDEDGNVVSIPHKDRVKLLIGTKSITEGINLQKWATNLYNLSLDWNPTDMIQLNGRIWRQGNNFGNVRIVVPLMENSLDTFIWSKIDDKTRRINQIWNRTRSTNEVDTRTLDPKEIMLSLITDPEEQMRFQQESRMSELVNEEQQVSNELANHNTNLKYFIDIDSIIQLPKLREESYLKIINKPLFFMYEWLKIYRPDLVEKSLIKEERVTDIIKRIISSNKASLKMDKYSKDEEDNYVWFDEKEDGSEVFRENEWRKNQELANLVYDEEDFNYTPFKLVELMNTARKERKIVYPASYNPNWLEEKIVIKTLKVGDRVSYQDPFPSSDGTPKPKQFGLIIQAINEYGFDIMVEYEKWKKTIEGGTPTPEEEEAYWKEPQNRIDKVRVKLDTGEQVDGTPELFDPVTSDTEEVVVEEMEQPPIDLTNAITKANAREIRDLGLYQLRNSYGSFDKSGKKFKPRNVESLLTYEASDRKSQGTRIKNWALPTKDQKYYFGFNILDILPLGEYTFGRWSTDIKSEYNGSQIVFYSNPQTKRVDFRISNFSSRKEVKEYLEMFAEREVDKKTGKTKSERKAITDEEVEKYINSQNVGEAGQGAKEFKDFFDRVSSWEKMLEVFDTFTGTQTNNWGEYYYARYGMPTGFFIGGWGSQLRKPSYQLDYISKMNEFNLVVANMGDISTKGQLEKAIKETKERLEEINFNKEKIKGEEWIKDKIREIIKAQELEKLSGVKTPSTPEQRANEFATPIIDKDGFVYYYGNEYSGITLYQEEQVREKVKASVKELVKEGKVKYETDLREAIRKARTLDWKDIPVQQEVEIAEVVEEPVFDVDKEIEAIKFSLQYLDGEDKEAMESVIVGLELLK